MPKEKENRNTVPQKKKNTGGTAVHTEKETEGTSGRAGKGRTDRRNSKISDAAIVKAKESKKEKPKKDVKEDQKKKSARTPSESWNVIMPYLLCVVGGLLALLYIIVFIGKISSGVGDGGAVGDFLLHLISWLIGRAYYFVPAALIVMALRWRRVTERGKTHGGLWLQFSALLVLTAAIIELLSGDSMLTFSAYGDALLLFDDGVMALLPGGFAGGLVAIVMRWALRQVFSVIVLILLDLLVLMFFLGLTPEVIFHFLKEHHERNRERRAEYLREVEEARRAEAEAADAERRIAEESKKEEERLKKEEEAVRKAREREQKRLEEEARAAEEKRLREERERELEEERERQREEAEQAAHAADRNLPPETESDTDAPDSPGLSEEDEASSREASDQSSEESAEEDGSDAPLETAGTDETDRFSSASDEDADQPYPSAADLDFTLNEETAKRPKTVLDRDDELIGAFGTRSDRPAKRETAAAPVPQDQKDDFSATSDLPLVDEKDLLGEIATEAPASDQTAAHTPEENAVPAPPEYLYPPVSLLTPGKGAADISKYIDEIEQRKEELAETLKSFGIRFRKIDYTRGPTITRYEIQPELGQRVKGIQNLMDDIALNLGVSGVRFDSSIEGKSAVGIEVPNQERDTVSLRTLIESEEFIGAKSKVTACLGADIAGKPVVFDVSKMPHLIVAGATGTGKSVCINSIIVSLLYKAKPEELRLILIDPKKVEFAIYRDMPHLMIPIITDPSQAAGALCSAVAEMERRFELIERAGVRDIGSYKQLTANDPDMPNMCHIVIIIDEFADLMMTASGDVETAVCRLAQKARAAGIHLIIGTQRPSVNVITGTIKANIPSRIACTVASQTDSRTILDSQGAEKLCGRGDMIFAPMGAGNSKPRRVQGAFVSDSEVIEVVRFLIRNNGTANYDVNFMENIAIETERCMSSKKASEEDARVSMDGEDEKLEEAIVLAIESGKISTSFMQRNLKVGYGRAASIIDRMQALGIVSEPDGNKPRKVLITMDEYLARTSGGGGAESGSDGETNE